MIDFSRHHKNGPEISSSYKATPKQESAETFWETKVSEDIVGDPREITYSELLLLMDFRREGYSPDEARAIMNHPDFIECLTQEGIVTRKNLREVVLPESKNS